MSEDIATVSVQTLIHSKRKQLAMRSKSITALVLPLVLAAGLAGCSSVSATAPSDVTNTSGGPAAPAAPKDPIGTRTNPAPVSTSISLKDISGNPDYETTLGTVVLDAAAAVTAANQFNSAPKPGFQYILVPVTYKYVGKKTGTPAIGVRIEFVSAAGTTHTSSDSIVVMPGDETAMNEIYPGASATGKVVIMIPTADAAKGLLTVGRLFGGSKFFVKLA